MQWNVCVLLCDNYVSGLAATSNSSYVEFAVPVLALIMSVFERKDINALLCKTNPVRFSP
jgi:hypothetical protein